MPIIDLEDVPKQPFRSGATQQVIVGDDQGTTPIRYGFQSAEPGYSTGMHRHPYLEVVTVVEGRGEAWIEDQTGFTDIGPGITLVFPANVKHGFRVTGTAPLKTYSVHVSPRRVAEYFPDEDP